MEKRLIFLLLLTIICKSVCGTTQSSEQQLHETENLDNSTISTTDSNDSEKFVENKAIIIKRDSAIEAEDEGNVNFENTGNLSETMENDFQEKTIEDVNEIEQEDELNWDPQNKDFPNSDFKNFPPTPRNFGRIKSFQKTDWEHNEELLESPSKHLNVYYNLPKFNHPHKRPYFKDMNLPKNKINNYNRYKSGNQIRYKLNPSIDVTVDKEPEHCSDNKPIVINLKTECQACHHHPTTSHNFPKHDLVPKSHFFSQNHPKIHHHNYQHHHSPISPRHNPLHINTQHGSFMIPNHQSSLIPSNFHHPVISTSCHSSLISAPKQKSLISSTHHHPIMSSLHPLSVFCK